MYQMLSGELPFKADTSMAMLLAHMQKPPTPILSLHPELQIPEPIGKVVMGTLEKNPDKRPQNAEILINEIDGAEQRVALVTPALGMTRVVEPSGAKPRPVEPASAYSPAGAARALRESLRAAEPGARRESAARAVAQEPAPTAPPQPPPPAPRPRTPAMRAEPVMRPAAVYAAPPPRKSRTGLWIAMSVLLVGLVVGGLYVIQQNSMRRLENANTSGQTETPVSKPPAGQTETPPQPSGSQTPPASTGSETSTPQQPTETQPAVTPTPPAQVEPTEVQPQKRPQRAAARENPPRRPPVKEEPVQKPTVDPAKIAAAKKLGEFYFNRGEYDNAIAEYQRGLDLDPNNAELRDLLERAKKAKAAESRVLQ